MTDEATVREVTNIILSATTCALQDYDVSIEAITGDVELHNACAVAARAAIAAHQPTVAEAPKIPPQDYVKTKPNQWVWSVCDGYEVIVTQSMGDDQDWSFRVNNAGRCFIESREAAMEMALVDLKNRVEKDTNVMNNIQARLRALTTTGEDG